MTGPLQDKRVLVTRAAEECAELEELLRARGAMPVRLPCIAFEDGPGVARVGQFVQNADLVVVSSPHGARRLLALCADLYKTPLAAVGEATARVLGGQVVFPKSGAGAQALVSELGDSVRGKRVLLPRAQRSTPALAAGLRAAGAEVEELILYKTIVPPLAEPRALRALQDGLVDAITFASGSAVRGFVQLVGARSAERSAIACLGPTAAGAALAAGLTPDWRGEGEGLAELCEGVELAVARHSD
ncbi:MAG TPA: uroporphyrinogen-III synthase [Myxococcales bacterium]|nr:uroporphyrinogen-III synthase [Myxococcales bacterium]